MSSVRGVKGSLVNIQSIIDGELYGSISDGDYLSLVNVIKSVYDKNVRTAKKYITLLIVSTIAILEFNNSSYKLFSKI
jgi:hypothetical protein